MQDKTEAEWLAEDIAGDIDAEATETFVNGLSRQAVWRTATFEKVQRYLGEGFDAPAYSLEFKPEDFPALKSNMKVSCAALGYEGTIRVVEPQLSAGILIGAFALVVLTLPE